jgi:hypothetical protein
MRSDILHSTGWTPTAEAPRALLDTVADVPNGQGGTVPMVIHFPGFDPAEHLVAAHPDPQTASGWDELVSLGTQNHLDAAIWLAGGASDGIDEHPVFGTPLESRQGIVLDIASGMTREDAMELERQRQELIRLGRGNQPFIDMLILRQMRAMPKPGPDGRPTNQTILVAERKATLRRAYTGRFKPTRKDRIDVLLEDALPFARVQAHNLSMASTPRPEMKRGAGGDYG